MALKAGRVGVAPDQVDDFGKVKSDVTSGYSKQEADAKFETQTAASEALALKQPKRLEVPIEMLSGTKLTVEDALRGLNEELTYNSLIIGQTGCTLQVVKYGKIVEIRRDSVTSLPADTDTIVGQLPAGYRPKRPIAIYDATHDDNKCKMQVGNDGNVTIRTSNANYFLPMCLTFIAEQ